MSAGATPLDEARGVVSVRARTGSVHQQPRKTHRSILCLLTGVALTLWTVAPAVAHAQEAAPEGVDRVFVQREGPGDELRGHLLELGTETITLLVDGQRLKVPLAGVVRVDRAGDGLKNGALIGAVLGGVWCALVCGQGLEDTGALPLAVAVTALSWAGIGAGVDALIPGRTTIYRRPQTSAAGRPVLGYRVRF
jgi:hypothetical protein